MHRLVAGLVNMVGSTADGRVLRPSTAIGTKAAVAILLGRALFYITRKLRTGGTALPGKVALRLEPKLIALLSRQIPEGIVVVTGTNGKTTVSRILSRFLSRSGRRVLANRDGANIVSGIATTLLRGYSLKQRGCLSDIAVIETDEKTVPRLLKSVTPRAIVVTNLFRDQLDRSGEPEMVARALRTAFAGLPETTALVLNADDPMVSNLATGTIAKVLYYGIDAPLECRRKEEVSDANKCPQCGNPLEYSRVVYSHLGTYSCDSCGFRRPKADVSVRSLRQSGVATILELMTPDGLLTDLSVALSGMYNMYNAVAAFSALSSAGADPTQIPLEVGAEALAFGRMETLRIGDKNVLLALVKNPTGANETIDVLAEKGLGVNLLFALNDNAADGTDISWIWDASIERLVGGLGLEFVVATGTRAEDAAIRLKYSGVPEGALGIEVDLAKALRMALQPVGPGGTLVCLVTYTALLQLRAVLARFGMVGHFWEV